MRPAHDSPLTSIKNLLSTYSKLWLGLVALTVSACAQRPIPLSEQILIKGLSSPAEVAPEQYDLYEHPQGAFTIVAPVHWTLHSPEPTETIFFHHSPSGVVSLFWVKIGLAEDLFAAETLAASVQDYASSLWTQADQTELRWQMPLSIDQTALSYQVLTSDNETHVMYAVVGQEGQVGFMIGGLSNERDDWPLLCKRAGQLFGLIQRRLWTP